MSTTVSKRSPDVFKLTLMALLTATGNEVWLGPAMAVLDDIQHQHKKVKRAAVTPRTSTVAVK